MRAASAESPSRPAPLQRRPRPRLATGGKATTASPHLPALEALGLEGPRRDRLSRYLDALASWNERVNLTAARTPADRVRLLVAEALPALRSVAAGTLLDVGSGNGSPGLVFALLREDLQVTLLEPRARRWAFLREAARAAGAPRVEVLRARHDTYAGPPAGTLTLRALRLPLAELEPLVAVGGRLIVLGACPEESRALILESGAPGGVHVFRKTDVPRET